MRDNPTLPAVLVQLKALANGLGKPFDVDVEVQADRYLKSFQFHGLPMTAVERAVDEVTNTSKSNRWPTPGTLSEIARKYIPKTDGERNRDGFGGDTCPQCGFTWFWVGYELNDAIYPRARCGCPQSASGWWTERALDWKEPPPQKPEARMPARPNDYLTNRRYRVRA